jgi:hypothetical protein
MKGDRTLLYLASNQADAVDGSVYYIGDSKKTTFTIVVFAEFDPTAGDAGKPDIDDDGVYNDQGVGGGGTRENANSTATLDEVLLQLDQVRDTGALFG